MARRLHSRLVLAACLFSAACAVHAAVPPEPPRRSVDLGDSMPPGRTVHLAVGADLQQALDRAAPGDILSLDAKGVWVGSFTLPRKSGRRWITIRSEAPDAYFPAPGTHVDPSHASLMPKLIAAGPPVIVAAPGAHHYRFEGIEMRPLSGTPVQNLIELGDSSMSNADVPHHIAFVRCYLHGDPEQGTRRGIALNSGYSAVVDSWLGDFKDVGYDSQAIGSWSGPGPFLISGNFLEAAGENILFGGSDPPTPLRIPSDIDVVGNHFAKPVFWREGDPEYAGTAWTVKNLFELKNARRVMIRNNLFENNWAQAQSGFAILFTVRNQDGTAPWSVVEDVAFVDNVVRHSGAGVNILGIDDNQRAGSARTRRVMLHNNLFVDFGSGWGGNGTWLQILNGTTDVIIENNTALQSGNVITADGAPHQRFVFRANISVHNDYGIVGTGTGPGASTLNAYFPGAVVKDNVFIGGDPASYPRGNLFAPSLEQVFADSSFLAPQARYSGAGARGLAGLETLP